MRGASIMVRGLTEMFGRRFLFCNGDFFIQFGRTFHGASFHKNIKILSFSQAEIKNVAKLLIHPV